MDEKIEKIKKLMVSENREERKIAASSLFGLLMLDRSKAMEILVENLKSDNVFAVNVSASVLVAAYDNGADVSQVIPLLFELYGSEEKYSQVDMILGELLYKINDKFRESIDEAMEDDEDPDDLSGIELSEEQIETDIKNLEADDSRERSLAVVHLIGMKIDNAKNEQIVSGVLEVLDRNINDTSKTGASRSALNVLKSIAKKGGIVLDAIPILVGILRDEKYSTRKIQRNDNRYGVKGYVSDILGYSMKNEKNKSASMNALLELMGDEDLEVRIFAIRGLSAAVEKGLLTERDAVRINQRMKEVITKDKDEALKSASKNHFANLYKSIVAGLKISSAIDKLKLKKQGKTDGKFRIRRT